VENVLSQTIALRLQALAQLFDDENKIAGDEIAIAGIAI
jgi:hypothetical protein